MVASVPILYIVEAKIYLFPCFFKIKALDLHSYSDYMCYNSIKSRSNSHNLCMEHGRLYNNFPCGRCGEDDATRTMQMAVRAMLVYKLFECSGYYSMFLTFTYSDDYLPHFNGIPCFNYKDLRKFINNLTGLLRVYCKKNDLGERYKKLAYMWSNDYANDEKFTQRPHYHTILHVPLL